MIACRVFGHRVGFRAAGATVQWSCRRCGQAAGSKTYGTEAEAQRYARAFDRSDSDDSGRRAPLLGMFPLRIWRLFRRR
ncbi:DUF1660 family phage protein [Spelaeicoccus albus]|uniref:DUF1660 family phage protein n=1 Tax=Spelaeicoccus albus TaxID=1280376 RepID=UPI0015C6D577|nr:DUF1660 family phage protein [Spelaeicoccus albus]